VSYANADFRTFRASIGFVTDLIVDAEELRAHADKRAIDIEDIKLAITSKVAHSFIQPPPRQVRSGGTLSNGKHAHGRCSNSFNPSFSAKRM